MTTVPAVNAPRGILKHVRHSTLHRWARCWRITRSDGAVLRFTEAAQPIVVLTGADTQETFDPTDGMSTSAEQLKGGLQEQNFEATGVLSDSRIEHDDLRAGLYADARVDVLLVDWSAPELGPMRSRSYWIESLKYDGATWTAQISGLPGWMRRNEGDVYARECQHDLGDSRCKVALAGFAESATVSAVTDQRKGFTTNVAVHPDGYFAFGRVTWGTGNNAGLTSEVASSLQTGGALRLRLPTPFDIQAGDTFSVTPGCQKRRDEDCVAKFNNLANFGGFPFVPGTDRMLKVPGQK